MLKLKIFDKGNKSNPEYLFSSFEELYNTLLDTYYLSNDCDYLTGYILEKFKINESAWDQFLDDLNEKNLDTDYYNDFDKFLSANNIDYSINNLTDQDYYNIINDNLSINGSYKYFYQIENSNIEIDTYLIKFFDESGNNIIDNLIFCENLLNEELTTLELRQKFLLLFNRIIEEYPGVYIDDLFDKYCIIFEDKIYNSENDTYMIINSPNFDIYDYDYSENETKRYLVYYEVKGISREWVFYAKNKAKMSEMLFAYKIPEDCENNYKIYNIIEI